MFEALPLSSSDTPDPRPAPQNKKGALPKQSASESFTSFTSLTSSTSYFFGLDSGGTNPLIR
jgi:hypothetical protein